MLTVYYISTGMMKRILGEERLNNRYSIETQKQSPPLSQFMWDFFF